MTLVDFHQYQLQKKATRGAEKALHSGALRGRVEGFHGDSFLIERLKEMGLHQGLEVQAVGQAPFGGPLLFRFGNTVLALRKEEAQCTLIEIL